MIGAVDEAKKAKAKAQARISSQTNKDISRTSKDKEKTA
jgi:hypothetical protein